MKYTYKTRGTCSQYIDFEIDENNIVHNVEYTGGCHGNTQALARLVEGMSVDEISEKIGGIRCGFKKTSCGDQLVQGLKQALSEK